MKFFKSLPLRFWALCLGIIFILPLTIFKPFNNYELLTYDWRFRLKPVARQSPDIILIEIADDTLKNLGNWPLPRDFHADLVSVLKEEGARLIVFDVLFSEPTVYDEAFAGALEQAGNVFLPEAYTIGTKAGRKYTGSDLLLSGILEILRPAMKGKGHINVFVDSDGKSRSVPLFIKYKNELVPHLGFAAACYWLGINEKDIELPVSEGSAFMVNYPARWEKSFLHLSYFEILKSYSQKKRGLKPVLDLSVLKGKACFIGLTAVGTSDLKPMPLENIYPMLGLQASVFNSIITGQFITEAPSSLDLLLNWLIFILAFFICLRLPVLKAFLGSLTLGVSYFVFSFVLFILGLWVNLFYPFFIIALTYVLIIAYRVFNETKRRELMEKELDIARTIQRSFLPEQLSSFEGLTVASYIQPAKFVAGDLYDVVKLDGSKVGVFIGDVSGKGVPAALIMAQTISFFRMFSRDHHEPKQVLERLNKELYGKFSGRFVTALYIVVDTTTGEASVVSAGHAPVLLYQKDTHKITEVELDSGLPLGVMEEVEYTEVKFNVKKQDKVLFFTDGLFEARNPGKEEFGLERVKKAIIENIAFSGERLTEAIKERLTAFTSHAVQHDDITLLVLDFDNIK